MSNEQKDPLLSFVTSRSGDYLAIHLDLLGVDKLIDELQLIKNQLEMDDCPHSHLFAWDSENGLTQSKIETQSNENNIVQHVKIYGWNEEWAKKHGLKS